MKILIGCIALLLMVNSCARSIQYEGRTYSIEDSEFGVAIIEDNHIEYFMDETIYQSKNQFYCRISKNGSTKWILISGGKMTDIDSASIEFDVCKPMNKRVLIE